MGDWKPIRIGNICKLNQQTYSLSEKWPYVNYLDTGNITENRINEIQKIVTDQDTLPSRARRKVAVDDILYSTVRPNQRHYGILKEVLPNMLVSTGFAVITADKSVADSNFLYFYLSQNDIVEGLHAIGEQSVSAYPSIKPSDIEGLELMLPPLPEQIEIGRTLRALDDKIENNRKINHHLKKIAQAVFKSWFVDFEPFGGEMPVDWRVVEFSSFLTIRVGKSNDPSIPLFSVTDTGIYPRSDKFNKNLSKAETKNKIAYETDIVFGMSREILNWGIMRAPIGGVSSAYNVFAVASDINSKYLESFIKAHSLYFKDLIRPATREGQSVDKSALMLKSMYLPPDDVLAEYYAIEDSLTSEIQGNGKESAHLADLRDTLLPRLMSGELSVAEI